MEPIKVDASELYQVRMIILLETSPQSNKYEQMIFTNKQYSDITKFIHENVYTKTGEWCQMKTLNKEIVLPDLQECI